MSWATAHLLADIIQRSEHIREWRYPASRETFVHLIRIMRYDRGYHSLNIDRNSFKFSSEIRNAEVESMDAEVESRNAEVESMNPEVETVWIAYAPSTRTIIISKEVFRWDDPVFY